MRGDQSFERGIKGGETILERRAPGLESSNSLTEGSV